MALSGSYQNGRTGYTAKTEWTAIQNIEENYSDLTIKLYLICGNRYDIYTKERIHKVYIDGTPYEIKSSLYSHGGETLYLGSTTKRIYHNPDGTREVNLSTVVQFNATIKGTYVTNVNGGSDTITLDKIPRMSNIKNTMIGSRYLNSPHTLQIDKFLTGNITHDIWYIIYGDDATKTSNWHYIARNTSSLDVEFVPTLDHIELQPNNTTIYLDFGIKTYKDGELYGEIAYSKGWHFKIPENVKPTITNVEIVEADEKTKPLGLYVQNHSKLNIRTTAEGIKGSTIQNVKVTIAGQTLNGANITTSEILESGEIELNVTVTDSRNRTDTLKRKISIEPYFLPTISNFSGHRLEENQSKVSIQNNFKMASLLDKNTCKWKIERRQIGTDNWVTFREGREKILNNSIVHYNIDESYDFEFRLTISDFYNEANQTFFIFSAFRLVSWHPSGTGMAIGQISKTPNMFDINLKTTFHKGIEVEKWTKMHLYNSTTPYNAKNELKYFKDPFGLVHIQGVVKDTTSEWLARITRADCRPEKDLIISVPCTGFKFAFLKIYEDGNILIDNRSEINTNWISLDGITFKAKE